MTQLIELYQQITEKMAAIGALYTRNVDIQILYSEYTEEGRDHVLFFQEELKKLESCLERIQYFREIAEKHIISLNTLPIVPREVDMTRIKTWADRIDFFSDDDPYAARLYVLCRSNELYLNKKITLIKDILTALGSPSAARDQAVLQNHEQEIMDACRQLIESSEYQAFMDLLYPERKEQESEKAETELSEESDSDVTKDSEESADHTDEVNTDPEETDQDASDLLTEAGDTEPETQEGESEADPENDVSAEVPQTEERQQEAETADDPAEEELKQTDESEDLTK